LLIQNAIAVHTKEQKLKYDFL